MCFHNAASAEIVQALVALEQKCFSTPWGEKQYHKAFQQTSFYVFALQEQSAQRTQGASLPKDAAHALLAYVALYHTYDEMEILNIAVKPAMRRQGAGKKILTHVLKEMKKLGVQRAVLEVRVNNTPARGLYESVGFELVGMRKKYYADTGEDACVYALAL